MADYIYTMEIRLTPDQQRGVTLVQDIARAAGMNIYLTGGAVRDIISGFPIRDLDFSVQGNPLKLQKDLEKAGVRIAGVDDDFKTLYLGLPGNVQFTTPDQTLAGSLVALPSSPSTRTSGEGVAPNSTCRRATPSSRTERGTPGATTARSRRCWPSSSPGPTMRGCPRAELTCEASSS